MVSIENSEEYYSQKFDSIDCSNSRFYDVEFEDCVFVRCKFISSEFIGCKFMDCKFMNCDLSLVKLKDTVFSEVDFSQCKILGVNWTTTLQSIGARLAPISLNECVINDSSFSGLQLEKLKIKDCVACDVDFRNTNLASANFSGTELSNSMFHQTNLKKANFDKAVNYYMDLRNNDISGAKFNRFEAVNLLQALGVNLLD